MFNSCTSGCSTAGVHNVVPITDRKVLEYQCSDSCQTVFGGMTQTWSLFTYNGAGVLQNTNIIGTDGLLIASECSKPLLNVYKITCV